MSHYNNSNNANIGIAYREHIRRQLGEITEMMGGMYNGMTAVEIEGELFRNATSFNHYQQLANSQLAEMQQQSSYQQLEQQQQQQQQFYQPQQQPTYEMMPPQQQQQWGNYSQQPMSRPHLQQPALIGGRQLQQQQHYQQQQSVVHRMPQSNRTNNYIYFPIPSDFTAQPTANTVQQNDNNYLQQMIGGPQQRPTPQPQQPAHVLQIRQQIRSSYPPSVVGTPAQGIRQPIAMAGNSYQQRLQQHHEQQQQLQKSSGVVANVRKATPYDRPSQILAQNRMPAPAQHNRMPSLSEYLALPSTSTIAVPSSQQQPRSSSWSGSLSNNNVPTSATTTTLTTSGEPTTVRSLILGFSSASKVDPITGTGVKTVKPSVDRQQPLVTMTRMPDSSIPASVFANPNAPTPQQQQSNVPVPASAPELTEVPIISSNKTITPSEQSQPAVVVVVKTSPPSSKTTQSTSVAAQQPNITITSMPMNSDAIKAKLRDMCVYKDSLKFIIKMLAKTASSIKPESSLGSTRLQYLKLVYEVIEHQKLEGVTLQFLQKAESDIKILLAKSSSSPEMAAQMFAKALEKAASATGNVDAFHSMASKTFSQSLGNSGDVCFELGDEWNSRLHGRQTAANNGEECYCPIFPGFDKLSRPAQRELLFLSQNYALSVADCRTYLPECPRDSSSSVDDGCVIIALAPCQTLLDAGVPAISLMVPIFYPEQNGETPQIFFRPAADFDSCLGAVKEQFLTMLNSLLETTSTPSIVQLMSIFEAAAISQKSDAR